MKIEYSNIIVKLYLPLIVENLKHSLKSKTSNELLYANVTSSVDKET